MARAKKLSQKDLDHFKERLLKERERILFVLNQIKNGTFKANQHEISGEISLHGTHMADGATDSYNTDFRFGLVSNEEELLEEIDAALERIENGTYGLCEKYQTPIPKARLEVMPYTRYSIKAQEEEERARRGHA